MLKCLDGRYNLTCLGIQIHDFCDDAEKTEWQPANAKHQGDGQEDGGGPLQLPLLQPVKESSLLKEVVDLDIDHADDEQREGVLEEDTDDGVAESVLLLQNGVLTKAPVLNANFDFHHLHPIILWHEWLTL